MLFEYVESKTVKDQMILILAEPKRIDLIFCVLLEESVIDSIESNRNGGAGTADQSDADI